MQKQEQEEFRPWIENRIGELKTALEDSTEGARAVSPDKGIGRLSRLDAMQMQQMTVGARNRQRQEIQFLQEALRRIDRGDYGRCQLCRGEIPRERLEYQLDAQICVGCARKR